MLQDHELSGEIVSLWISYFSLFITLGFLPVALVYILSVDGAKLNSQEFKEKARSIYAYVSTFDKEILRNSNKLTAKKRKGRKMRPFTYYSNCS